MVIQNRIEFLQMLWIKWLFQMQHIKESLTKTQKDLARLQDILVHILIIQLQKLLEFWVAFPKINIFISVLRSLVLFALDSYQAENGQQLTNIEQLSGSTIVSPGQLYCFAPIQVVKYIESGPQKTLLSG